MDSAHGSGTFAEQNTCTRYCKFKPVFGNVWECLSHARFHVCDHVCANQTCPLKGRTFTHVAQVKRKTEDEECQGSMKRPWRMGE